MDRRTFLKSTAAIAIGLGGLGAYMRYKGSSGYINEVNGFGPLVDDPDDIFSLPEGFSYKILSRTGDKMNDGLFLPGRPDGMAAFEGPNGTVTLVRNHENNFDVEDSFHRGDENLFSSINPNIIFDAGEEGYRPAGGTTNLTYDPKTQTVVDQRASLVGTVLNCAGGPTPRGTWLTCEETHQTAGDGMQENHGYVFEVPSKTSELGKQKPVAIRAMGRFNHEATATDPISGFVYQTEDEHESLIYRYDPVDTDDLTKGGKLMALAIEGLAGMDTRNWPDSGNSITEGQEFQTSWVEMDDVDNANDDLRFRGREKGAAIFARGEGMWFGNGSIYFTCTNGGPNELGQIWQYTPNHSDPQNPDATGILKLMSEPRDSNLIQMVDNITVAPWGDLIVCEDGPGPNFLRGIKPNGDVYTLGRNDYNSGELAGSCFSPDGTTLFFNLQTAEMTLAVTGPWGKIRS